MQESHPLKYLAPSWPALVMGTGGLGNILWKWHSKLPALQYPAILLAAIALAAYFIIMIVSSLIVSIDGFSFETSLTAVIATLSNIGPGLGMVGPTGNFAAFSDVSKLVLSLCMLIGRLEIFPVLMLVSPSAWRK